MRMSKEQKQKYCKQVSGEVAKRLHMTGHGIKEVCPKFGMNYGTYYNREKAPERFTLEELLDIASYFNISLFTLLGKDVTP